MTIDFKLYGLEITVILSWYEYVKNNSLTLGRFDPLLPLEQGLVHKLAHHENEAVTFTETEIELLSRWMNMVIYSKYGSDEHLFGYERRAYMKLKTREGVVVP
ncbi:MAG: hypothetical protein JW863_15730 [Chitinispirillaceae bacterium]|nr:hypothetical protein [Chitinispirillaceae bacterium]